MLRTPIGIVVFVTAVVLPGSAIADAPTAGSGEGTNVADCLERLGDRLDDEGYTHRLVLERSLAAPSVVDATEALAGEGVAAVTLLTDGTRAHAVTPFANHRAVRMMMQRARDMEPRWGDPVCLFTEMLARESQTRGWLRGVFLAIAIVCLGAFATARNRVLTVRNRP